MPEPTRDSNNVYAQLERLKRVANEAVAELDANTKYIDDLESRVKQRDQAMTTIKEDNKNLQAVLQIMAANNPSLYEWAAKQHNLM